MHFPSGIRVSGLSPGPLIAANKFDQMNLNVLNHINDPGMRRSLTIHWHGLFQNRTNSNDGPAFVTQCPITSGHAFEYRFANPEQTGACMPLWRASRLTLMSSCCHGGLWLS